MKPETELRPPFRRLPPWLKKRFRPSEQAEAVRKLLADLHLSTVCCGAHCPNQAECFGLGTAAFLILGATCTRNCRFCAIRSASPQPPRADEPQAVAEAAARLKLSYVVITSVARDDLPDGGAGHFARTIRAVRDRLPQARVEVLTPDFRGHLAAVDTVLAAGPDVFNHNVETVPRLYPLVRPQADYRRSLRLLAHARKRGQEPFLSQPGVAHGPLSTGKKVPDPFYTKSGLMVGLGESDEEVRQVMRDLRQVGCDMLTIGQYLAPSAEHVPVARYVEPAEFDAWGAEARALGFPAVAAGPFVRSSYQAERLFSDQQGRD